MAFPPGTTEGVGDDYRNISARALANPAANQGRRSVRVLGQERHKTFGTNIRCVDTRIGADEAMLRLRDQDRASLPDNPVALAEDQLDETRILLRLDRDPLRLWRWGDAIKRDDAAFRLRDDLLGHDNDIVGLDAGLVVCSVRDQSREVVAVAYLEQALDGDDADIYAAARQM